MRRRPSCIAGKQLHKPAKQGQANNAAGACSGHQGVRLMRVEVPGMPVDIDANLDAGNVPLRTELHGLDVAADP